MDTKRPLSDLAKAAEDAAALAKAAVSLLQEGKELDLARQVAIDLRDETAEIARDLELWAKGTSTTHRIPPQEKRPAR